MIDCTKLPGRLRDICDGTSGLPESGPGNTRENYLRLWENLPPLEVPSLECVHRGEHLDCAACPDCPTGKVRLKVFACGIHGRCVMGKTTPDVKGCLGCNEQTLPSHPDHTPPA